jgi:nucleotide-binding universal stress UspA family protein
MILLKKILVATDFSKPSERALAYGRELARTFGAQLVVAHVVGDMTALGYADPEAIVYAPDLQREIEDTARHQLEVALTAEDYDQLRAVAVLLRGNSPAAALVEYAREADVDLMVIGTHGRGAVAHLLMGNVAERVVRTAPCPVLTVRDPEHDFLRPDALVAVADV